MTDPIPLKGKPYVAPSDAADIDSLWLDPKLGDGLVDVRFHKIAIKRPRDFFRVNPDPTFRRLTEIYTHKIEEQIEETHYLIAKAMQGVILEARRCTLVTCVYRDGTPFLWPLKLPREGERDNEAWVTARSAAKSAMGDRWTKLVWQRRSYLTRDAEIGYAPDPDWSKLPDFDELVRLAVGDNGVIRDRSHPVYCDLHGIAPKKPAGGHDDLF
jgi:hypothetical protein